jgi:hydroxymethylglutaryl-CoA reductase
MKVSENSSSHVTVDINLPSVEGKGAGSATEEEEEGRCREILSMQNANPAKSIRQKRQQTT